MPYEPARSGLIPRYTVRSPPAVVFDELVTTYAEVADGAPALVARIPVPS